MVYHWQFLGDFSENELEVAGLIKDFEDQIEAEEWLTDYYQDLTDYNVTAATLYQDENLIYGPMPLST